MTNRVRPTIAEDSVLELPHSPCFAHSGEAWGFVAEMLCRNLPPKSAQCNQTVFGCIAHLTWMRSINPAEADNMLQWFAHFWFPEALEPGQSADDRALDRVMFCLLLSELFTPEPPVSPPAQGEGA